MICKSVGMKPTCKEILLEVQLFREFSKGCTAGTPLALTSKACEWVKFWNVNSRERNPALCGLNNLCYWAPGVSAQEGKPMLVFQECFGQAALCASLPWTVLQQPSCQVASASTLYRCSLHWHFSAVISTKLKFVSDIYPKVLREGELWNSWRWSLVCSARIDFRCFGVI